MRKLTVFLIAFECMVFPPVGVAESLETFLENASGALLAEIHEGRDAFDQNPGALYKKMDVKLADLVDFPSITRGVMGNYYQDATTEQRAAFQSMFRTSIVELYTKTLIFIESEAIRVLPLEEEPKSRATVTMEVATKEGASHKLIYSMAKEDSAWRVRNIIVDGINLGLLYRNQFKAMMSEEHDDIDAVIRNWRPQTQNE